MNRQEHPGRARRKDRRSTKHIGEGRCQPRLFEDSLVFLNLFCACSLRDGGLAKAINFSVCVRIGVSVSVLPGGRTDQGSRYLKTWLIFKRPLKVSKRSFKGL